MLHDSYAQHDVTESERGNDMSNPTGGEWSLVAPTAKLYQTYLRAWLNPDAHTKHNRDNSCYSCQDDVDAATGTTDEGFISSQDHLRAWEKLTVSEHEQKQRNQHQQH